MLDPGCYKSKISRNTRRLYSNPRWTPEDPEDREGPEGPEVDLDTRRDFKSCQFCLGFLENSKERAGVTLNSSRFYDIFFFYFFYFFYFFMSFILFISFIFIKSFLNHNIPLHPKPHPHPHPPDSMSEKTSTAKAHSLYHRTAGNFSYAYIYFIHKPGISKSSTLEF